VFEGSQELESKVGKGLEIAMKKQYLQSKNEKRETTSFVSRS
jgi:hypothetical protein